MKTTLPPTTFRTIAGSIPLFAIVFASCSPAASTETAAPKKDSLLPPQRVVLADLPDSLQPEVISLSEMPAAKTIPLPTKKGGKVSFLLRAGKPKETELAPVQTTALPAMRTWDGELVTDKDGNPFILGDGGGVAPMQTFTTDNGLVLDAICRGGSLCDSKGRLWFGTEGGGVSCYDGKSFTNFTTSQGLSSNVVETIAEDKAGNIWFGTFGGGACCYNGKTFKTYTTAQGLAGDVVLKIKTDKAGNLWFGTNGGGVSKYDGKKFTNYTTEQGLAGDRVLTITDDKAGNVWFGTYGKGVSCFDGKTFTTFTTEKGLAADVIFSSGCDSTGNLWFGTSGGGVSKYDGKTFTNYTTAQGLADDHVLDIATDRNGNVWFSTTDGGVSRFDGKTFTSFTTGQGLPNNAVESITEDKAGNIWFGTQGGGVTRYDGKAFGNFTTAQGLAGNTVQCVAEDRDGNLWFGTQGNGVSRFDGKTFTTFMTQQGLANDVVMSIHQDRSGDIWFGTYGGLSRFDGKSFTTYTTEQGLIDISVNCITEDRDGNLWIGTHEGVSRFDGKTFTNYTSAQGLGEGTVFRILQDKSGLLWFAIEGGGISRFDGKAFTTYTTAQGLAHNDVFSMLEDKAGNLWFATYGGGVSRISAAARADIENYKGGKKLFENFDRTDGLPDDGVTQLVEGANGMIYAGTNAGVCELLPSPGAPKGVVCGKTFNSATGYLVKDVNTGQDGAFKDSKGRIWIGTGSDKSALVRFVPAALRADKTPPLVVLQGIRINEEALCWNELAAKGKPAAEKDSTVFPVATTEAIGTFGHALTPAQRDTMLSRFGDVQFDSITAWYPVPQRLVLPYAHNNVTFEYNAIAPCRHSLVQYQYMLEGYDKSWNPATTNSSASFGNIDEGTYTFRVKARSPEGVWSEPVTYTFTVLPPWWRTWWMYSAYGLSAVLSVVVIVRWNGRRLRARADELAGEVQKATIEIRHQKQIVEEKNKDITDSINYAKRIQQAKLPAKEHVLALLPQSFVLFRPKDIVSGDFYFAQKKNGLVFIAAADCTGHGVPGALMSMIGSEKLTEAVAQSSDPAVILAQLNKGIRASLRQSDSDDSTRDGMDIALCVVNTESRSVLYAGANRPAWIIRKGQSAVEEIKATKKALGGLTDNEQQFERHELQLQPGDTFYIFSDGYADTFSGENSKKLTTKRFREILVEISTRPMPEQEQYLDSFIEKWKGGTEQVDDILVIGVRL